MNMSDEDGRRNDCFKLYRIKKLFKFYKGTLMRNIIMERTSVPLEAG